MQTTCVIIGMIFLISIEDVDCSIGNKTFPFMMGLFLKLHFFCVGVDLFFGDLGDFICIDIAFAFFICIYAKCNFGNLIFVDKDVGFSYGEAGSFFISGNCVVCSGNFVFCCCRLDIDSCI